MESLETSNAEQPYRAPEGLGATAVFATMVGEAGAGDDLVASCGD